MAERKLEGEAGEDIRYDVPVDVGNARAIPKRGRLRIVWGREHGNRFDVYQKDIPEELREKTYKNKEINWLNNFGMKERGSKRYANRVPRYTVILDQIDGAEYVYYDGAAIQPLQTGPVADDSSKVQATLDLGDPPIGWIK